MSSPGSPYAKAGPHGFAGVGRRVLRTSSTVTSLRDAIGTARQLDGETLTAEEALARIFDAIGMDLSSVHFKTKTPTDVSHSFYRQALKSTTDSAFTAKVMDHLLHAGGSMLSGGDGLTHTPLALNSVIGAWNARKEASDAEVARARRDLADLTILTYCTDACTHYDTIY